MIRLYDYLISGNGYKVRLLLTQLEIPFERIELNITKGETRTPEFLRKFPNGRIPAVEFDDGKLLFESNAIIAYFAEGTPFMPTDRFQRAQILQWLFFEQYSHEPYIASVRYLVMHPDVADARRTILDSLMRPREFAASVHSDRAELNFSVEGPSRRACESPTRFDPRPKTARRPR